MVSHLGVHAMNAPSFLVRLPVSRRLTISTRLTVQFVMDVGIPMFAEWQLALQPFESCGRVLSKSAYNVRQEFHEREALRAAEQRPSDAVDHRRESPLLLRVICVGQ